MKKNHWLALAAAAVLLSALARTSLSGTTVIVEGKVTLLQNKSYTMLVTDEVASAMINRITHDLQIPETPADQDESGRPAAGLFNARAGQTTCYYNKNDSEWWKPKNARCLVDLKLGAK